MKTNSINPFGAQGFHRADALIPMQLNPILQKAGVRDIGTFVKHLTGYLAEIPELREVTKAADKLDCAAMLSGGSARAIVSAYLTDVQKTNKPDVRPQRSLFQMLEGSDVDVLVMQKGGGKVPESTVQRLMSELNRISGAQLVDKLPSVERRLYTAEWDITDAHEFASLNKRFGGDTVSLFGIGLSAERDMLLYDPADALVGISRGELGYVPGEKPYEHDMVVKGRFDPSLDGLRVIRMAGQMREVGVELTSEAADAVKALGDEANRRAWEIQARTLHSPGGKLQRRWTKYVKKVWIDHRDPAYARTLLQKTGYFELITLLGLRDYTLHELPAGKPSSANAHPKMQELVRTHRAALEQHVKAADGALFSWNPHVLASAMLEEKRFFGNDAGRLGPGLYTGGEQFPEGAIATELLEIKAHPTARVLDLDAANGVVHSILEDARPAYEAQNDTHPSGIKPLGDFWRSQALADLYAVLGVDGGRDRAGTVFTHAGAIADVTFVRDLGEGLIEQLRSKKLGDRTELGVRALLASRGSAGFDELKHLMKTGAVTLQHLFPATELPGGLFRDVPTVEVEFAKFLAQKLVTSNGLSQLQKDSVIAAVDYLRGNLPAELEALAQVMPRSA